MPMLGRTREKLEKELRALEKEYRQELPKEIHRALQMGDLRENAEYQAALERQHFVKSRIGQVQEQLKNLSMIDVKALPKDRAALGSSITVRDSQAGKTMIYELVLPEEADFAKGLVSLTSPIGRALMGCREGDEVTVKIPAGTRVFEVVKLVTLHEKEPE
jgi:transcription elongation factor GreA